MNFVQRRTRETGGCGHPPCETAAAALPVAVTITEIDHDEGYEWAVWCNACDRQLGLYGCIGDAEAMQAAHERNHG